MWRALNGFISSGHKLPSWMHAISFSQHLHKSPNFHACIVLPGFLNRKPGKLSYFAMMHSNIPTKLKSKQNQRRWRLVGRKNILNSVILPTHFLGNGTKVTNRVYFPTQFSIAFNTTENLLVLVLRPSHNAKLLPLKKKAKLRSLGTFLESPNNIFD